jgi:uncharacterized membrane protein
MAFMNTKSSVARAAERAVSRPVSAADHSGLIRLDITHLFWVFVLCSIIGLGIESLFHFVVYGGWQNRYGLVWGPFSPIYGCGAVLFTLILNRFWNRSVILIFLISMVTGCALEYLTGFILESFFGIAAWDYSGSFMSIGGKTSLVYGLMWGVLGVLWIRLLLPPLTQMLERAPLLTRPVVTAVFGLLLAFDVATTVAVLDREFQRARGIPATTAIEQLCDRYFPDEWCEQRFENMAMRTEDALR